MSEGSGQRYCGNCGTEIRSGTSFCVSCEQQVEGNGERTEANTSFGTTWSGSRGGSSLDQRNVRLRLLGVGALLVLVMAYFILSYAVALGFLLIVLLALAVLVIRKNRGPQTRREQQLFDTANQYKESAQKAYDEGKHREIAQNAYQQSRRVYQGANTLYQRWNQQKADERERNERINSDDRRRFTDNQDLKSRKAEYKMRRRRKPWETREEQIRREKYFWQSYWVILLMIIILIVSFVVSFEFRSDPKDDSWDGAEKRTSQRTSAIKQQVLENTDVEEREPFTYRTYDGSPLSRDFLTVMDEISYECEVGGSGYEDDSPYVEHHCSSTWEKWW